MIMSVGALGDPFFLSELLDIASKNGSHIYVPTGAIAGIDAIRSVKHLLDSVGTYYNKKSNSSCWCTVFQSDQNQFVWNN